ncbi:sulfotransferase 4A1-like isoform X1 [Mya arenaria]|uniref:sulfotransferase 4A1-like isoform X1 n=1 Tax=Mya arenaria TaxID=6604 RepID=UPI0022E5E5F6|nr:sulfotransferase 4A1-like isoform X1 [Mya arenaria]XP_052810656.1 sulfotransferase 4A1-like isoform X1 [Mya arenaria]
MAEKEAQRASTEVNSKPRFELPTRVYKGIMMMVNEVEQIEMMDTRPDDIWVCTHPRSGTTLTQEMSYLIETLDFETANNVYLDDRFPMIDILDDRLPFYRSVKHAEQMSSPRFIKCHLPYFLLPEQLRQGKGRIIYIARNPKDVVASYYRLQKWTDIEAEQDSSWDKFIDLFVQGKSLYGPWTKHVLGYWENRTKDNMLYLKYEDLVQDLPGHVRTIAAFLNKELSENDIDRICKHCHVESMRSNEKVNLSYYRDYKWVNDNAYGGFINKGKAGVWKDLLTPDAVKKIDLMVQELEGTGLVLRDN